MKRLAVSVAVVLAAVVGCARPGEREGAGEAVGLCEGWAEVEEVDQPDFTDPEDVVLWAAAMARVADRIDIDPDDRIDDELIPADVPGRVERVRVATAAAADSLAAGATVAEVQSALLAATFGEDIAALGDVVARC